VIYKPQVNIFAICDRVVRDQHGKPSLLGVFDTFIFPVFPATFPFVLFTQVTAPPGHYQMTVHLGPADGESKRLFESPVQVEDEPASAMIEANLNLAFDHPGLFEFRLYINDAPVLTRPFHVRQVA
jgi:hypothetical protein